MKIVGLMSGTSLDGLDVALCDIGEDAGAIRHRLVAAATYPYSDDWRRRLASLHIASALEYARAHVELGRLFGQTVRRFLDERGLDADAVASHGHTVFHQPSVGLTAQIGDADAIAACTGLPVVSGFRTLDVALGGQGAPLVPLGDELFFGGYDACLNLGGIANISYRGEKGRIAYDICPCNMVLNGLAGRVGLEYDRDGAIARQGRVEEALLRRLDALGYYAAPPPKSLGKEWVEETFWPVLGEFGMDVPDLMATAAAHIARQIARSLTVGRVRTLLVTGGGAFNLRLIELLKENAPQTAVTVPDVLTVAYKEALVFALLGYRRLRGEVNTLCSVTGARCDSCGGSISGSAAV